MVMLKMEKETRLAGHPSPQGVLDKKGETRHNCMDMEKRQPKKEVGDMNKDQVRMAGHPNPGGVEQYPGIGLVRLVMRDFIYALESHLIIAPGWKITANNIEKMNAPDLAKTLSSLIYDLYDERVLTLEWVVKAFQLEKDWTPTRQSWTLTIELLINLVYRLRFERYYGCDWELYLDLLKKIASNEMQEKGGEK